MATTRNEDEHERAAAGMDYDFPIREHASHLGATIAESGPEALFEEIEKMLPDSWREQIQTFPIAAVLVGCGIGVFLGMRKGDEVIAAVTSMVTAAAMSNVTNIMERAGGRGAE
jgi:urea transporter